jgi:hypothetical protein
MTLIPIIPKITQISSSAFCLNFIAYVDVHISVGRNYVMNFDKLQNYMKIKGIVNEYQLSSNSHWSVRFLQFCRGNIDCQCSEEWAHDFPANISKFREPWQATQLPGVPIERKS